LRCNPSAGSPAGANRRTGLKITENLIVAACVDWLYDRAMSNPELPAEPKRPLRRPLLPPDSLPELPSAIEGVDETVWVEVIRKMDEVYNDLLQYEVVLEQKNAALEDSQQFIESVLASMSDILIVCNRHGAIQEVNDSLCRFIGQDETVLRGQPVCDLFADERRSNAPAIFSRRHVRQPSRIASY
jgi:PAS domain-containing protein